MKGENVSDSLQPRPDAASRPPFEELRVGTELPTLVRGPLSAAHLMRWSAATENWHRIHYDQPYATQIESLPGSARERQLEAADPHGHGHSLAQSRRMARQHLVRVPSHERRGRIAHCVGTDHRAVRGGRVRSAPVRCRHPQSSTGRRALPASPSAWSRSRAARQSRIRLRSAMGLLTMAKPHDVSTESVTSSELDGRSSSSKSAVRSAARSPHAFSATSVPTVLKVEPPGGDPMRDPSQSGNVDGDPVRVSQLEQGKRGRRCPHGRRSPRTRCARRRGRRRRLESVPRRCGTSRASAGRARFDERARRRRLRDRLRRGRDRSRTGGGANSSRRRWEVSWRSAERPMVVRSCVGCASPSTTPGSTRRMPSMAGVYAARTSGEGVTIDLAVRDCVSAELIMNQSLYAFLGVLQSRPPKAADPLGGFPLPCSDGFMTIQASTAAPMSAVADLFHEPRLARPEYASKEGRTARSSELLELMAPTLSAVRCRPFFEESSRKGFLVGIVQGAADLLACEQLEARGAFQSFASLVGSDGQPLRFPASLGRLSGWRNKRPAARAPRLGEAPVIQANSFPPSGDQELGGPTQIRTFADLRVLDLSQVFAGPYFGALLADFGADVIKVEAPHRLDQARTDYGGYFENEPGPDPWNRTSTFQVINRGKRSISLDLKTKRGQKHPSRLDRGGRHLGGELHTPRAPEPWSRVRRPPDPQPVSRDGLQQRVRCDRSVVFVQGAGHHSRGDHGHLPVQRVQGWPAVTKSGSRTPTSSRRGRA